MIKKILILWRTVKPENKKWFTILIIGLLTILGVLKYLGIDTSFLI